jgi:hypothetical protein
MGQENVLKERSRVKWNYTCGKSGQQTPRRWGWGTPLKKRTAARTELLYGTTDDFVNWLLTSQQKRSGKFREQVAEHHHRGSRDGALMARCAVRRRVRRRRIRFGTSFLLYSFSPRNASCDAAARHPYQNGGRVKTCNDLPQDTARCRDALALPTLLPMPKMPSFGNRLNLLHA